MAKHSTGGGQGRPDHEAAVGYGRPPVEHRFRKGEPSRNPNGRRGKRQPPESAKARAPDFLDVIVTISVDGKPTRMTRDEAIDHALFSRAVTGGDTRAVQQLGRRRKERERRRVETEAMHAASSDADANLDAEIVARALARAKNYGGTRPRGGLEVDASPVNYDPEAEHGAETLIEEADHV